MTVREPTDAEALVAVMAGKAETGADHPEVDLLLDYQSGKLSSEAAAGVLDHLVGCRHCTQILLDLEAFPDAVATVAEPSNVVNLAAVAGWRDFKSRIAEPPRAVEPARGTPARALYALAASLLVGVVGLSMWVADLRQTVAEAYQHRPNTPIFYLDAATRDSEPDAGLIEVPPGEPFFVLVVLPDTAAFSRLEIELLDRQGREVWRGRGLELSESETVSVRFSRRLLGPGEYRLRLYGLDGDKRSAVVDSTVRIRYL